MFNKTVIAMIHVDPLPGTPLWGGSMKKVLDKAVKEALLYKECGVDMVAVENMHDTPYLNRNVGPEISASMAVVGYEVKRASSLPCGIQILAGANKEALACAFAAGLDFIRAEGFVFSHIADEGLINSCAGELLRYRSSIGANEIPVFTDIKKKHSSHAITSDVDIAETARAAEFFRSDGVIITGRSTGLQADLEEIKTVKLSIGIPVLVGSGVTIDNVGSYLNISDAIIVGSWFKHESKWQNPINTDKVKLFMEKVRKLRK